MTQKNAVNGELISALVDGEAAADELAQAVALASRTPQGQVAWHAYHVVGEALRGNPMALGADRGLFLERLRDRLSQEAVVRPQVDAQAAAPVVEVRAPYSDSANDAVVRWKYLAAAASLAAVATFGWHIASQQAEPAVLASVPAQPPAVAQAPAAAAVAEPAPMLRDARLDALMAAHKQYGGTSALQMPAGFLRNATFDGSGR